MNKRYQQYNRDCYVRNDFLDILSGALPIQYGRDTAKSKEEFHSLFAGFDMFDISVHYIYYPMPLVKEFYIIDWKDSFHSDRSSLHLEYWDEKWRLKKSVIKRRLSVTSKKERVESESIITKDQIFPEIVKYFQDVDPEIGKQLLRSYNLQIII